ncbi:hypothetical protein GALMADRAFT_208704 [Galerina marginata CBS 339.88]|uniref:CBM1 domain-containing protein n=1 Tax=Galerina marginata (strain CBS 339.88) TaxID=685588 RepID=A0A067TA74_GALM3|nr:hypothetical protein GALMADRAFT_208704 [Galerina marginata CBS 339.88]
MHPGFSTTFAVAFFSSLSQGVFASVPIFGQCGPAGYGGPTDCVAGLFVLLPNRGSGHDYYQHSIGNSWRDRWSLWSMRRNWLDWPNCLCLTIHLPSVKRIRDKGHQRQSSQAHQRPNGEKSPSAILAPQLTVCAASPHESLSGFGNASNDASGDVGASAQFAGAFQQWLDRSKVMYGWVPHLYSILYNGQAFRRLLRTLDIRALTAINCLLGGPTPTTYA